MIADKKVLRDAVAGMSKVRSEHSTKHFEAELDMAHLVITLQTLAKICTFPSELMKEHGIEYPEYIRAEDLLFDHLRMMIDKRKSEALRAEASAQSAKKSVHALIDELRAKTNA